MGIVFKGSDFCRLDTRRLHGGSPGSLAARGAFIWHTPHVPATDLRSVQEPEPAFREVGWMSSDGCSALTTACAHLWKRSMTFKNRLFHYNEHCRSSKAPPMGFYTIRGQPGCPALSSLWGRLAGGEASRGLQGCSRAPGAPGEEDSGVPA